MRGFAGLNGKARDLMIGNKLTAAQRSYELRRHLDGAAEEASIGNIVDSCRIWESHAETEFVGSVRQDPDDSQLMPQVTVSDKSLPATSESTRLLQDVGRVISTTRGPLPRVTHSSADRELLIQNVLEAVRAHLFPDGLRKGSWNLCCGTRFRLDQSWKKRHPRRYFNQLGERSH